MKYWNGFFVLWTLCFFGQGLDTFMTGLSKHNYVTATIGIFAAGIQVGCCAMFYKRFKGETV